MKNIIEWLYLRQTNNLAYYDRLTQLLNRNWWELYAKKRLNDKPLYLSIIDLDNLKKINDTEGHSSGDALLINFSNKLKEYFYKDKLCRLGGDEFLIISEQEPIETLFNLKEKEKFNFSFGVCIKSAAMNLSDALKHADEHMYCMKSWRKKINK